MYVMGWNNPDELGTAGALSPLEIQYADIIPGRATENVALIANINSEEEDALMKFSSL
jgi:flagellar hook protein FlgE